MRRSGTQCGEGAKHRDPERGKCDVRPRTGEGVAEEQGSVTRSCDALQSERGTDAVLDVT